MSITAIILILLALGSILGGVFLLKKSAKKFDLTDEQLEKINQRNKAQDKRDENDQ